MVHKKGLNIKAILALACIIILAGGGIYLIFAKEKCLSQSCLLNSLWKCKQVSYLNVQDNSTWYYKVQGMTGDGCKVYVEAKELKTDVETAGALIGKSMTCYIPSDVAGSFLPEAKIEYCHGLLKEAIQDLIIQKMHLFIVQNIGQINQSSIGITGSVIG